MIPTPRSGLSGLLAERERCLRDIAHFEAGSARVPDEVRYAMFAETEREHLARVEATLRAAGWTGDRDGS